MEARIYCPAKTAMQSGRGNAGTWIVEFELPTARRPEPLMGWVSSGDTLNQITMRFDSREAAEAFCKRKRLAYSVQGRQPRRVVPRNYGDKFRSRP